MMDVSFLGWLEWGVVTAILVFVARDDLKHLRIKNDYVLAVLAVGLLSFNIWAVAQLPYIIAATMFVRVLQAALFSLPITALYYFDKMGAGDVKMLAALFLVLPSEMPAVYLCLLPLSMISYCIVTRKSSSALGMVLLINSLATAALAALL